MEEGTKQNKLQEFFSKITFKEAAIFFGAVILAAAAVFSYTTHKEKKAAEFSQKIEQAGTTEEYLKIVREGCPRELLPELNFFLAKSQYEEGKTEEAYKGFEMFIKNNATHYLYGRAFIGYLHAGFQKNKDKEFLENAQKIIKKKDFPWKNEALYDLAQCYSEISLVEEASRIYKEIIASEDAVWKNNAEFKLAEMAKK